MNGPGKIPELNRSPAPVGQASGARHLLRAAALVLGILGIVFVVPRLIPVTESLERYGFYGRNEAGSAADWAAKPIQYVDSSVCTTCHADNGRTWATSKHSSVACEDCHGPAKEHVGGGAALTIDTAREACTLCHAQVIGRPASFPQVDTKTHAPSACVTCHNPHSPKAVVSREIPAVPHALEGRGDCLLCHNTGGLKPSPADHIGRTSATCLSCHKGK